MNLSIEYVFTFLIMGLIACKKHAGAQNIPSEEVDALSDFFFATNGPYWRIKSGWKDLLTKDVSTLNPCARPSWYGVGCIQVGNMSHVQRIVLNQNNMSADVFPAYTLKGLIHLQHLDVGNGVSYGSSPQRNKLGGPLDQLCDINDLPILYLEFRANAFSGTVPSCFGGLNSTSSQTMFQPLTYMGFNYNYVSGSIPTSICALNSLNFLSFQANQLTGSLPECLGDMSSLTAIQLSNEYSDGSFPAKQSLEGTLPLSLCKLSNLRTLELSVNYLTSSLPGCIGSLKELVYLDLFGNLITGTIPDSICDLQNLDSLELATMSMTGSIPECIGSMSNVTTLLLNENSFIGTIPESICELNKLGIIDFWINDLSGTLPSCISQMPSLYWIDIDSNWFTGTIPPEICDMKQLFILDIFDNKFTGTIPDCFGSNFKDMIYLLLSQNSFTGTIPLSICDMTSSIELLMLSDNFFSGTIPACLGNAVKISSLELDSNRFTGTLPNELCSLKNLNLLQLNNNKFSGKIPSCFGYSFPQLQVMLLHDNGLRGKLPEVWNLPRLQALILSNNNHLHGSLPDSIFHQQGNMTMISASSTLAFSTTHSQEQYGPNNNLWYLVIEGTSIKGNIPTSLCAAVGLQTLLLSGNMLFGTIPSCITQLDKLSIFRAAGNQISGTLMKDIDNMTSLTKLDLSRNRLSGTVPGSLGLISEQLEETVLVLNHLSCDLPRSVLQWELSPNFGKLNILDGNWFSCPDEGMFALSMASSQSKGLQEASGQDVKFYSCGGSAYVLPVTLPIVFLCCIGLVYLLVRHRLYAIVFEKSQNGNVDVKYGLNKKVFSLKSVNTAYNEIKRLSNSIKIVSFIALIIVFPMTFFTSQFAYECEYTARITIGGKLGKDMLFSIMLGLAVSFSTVFASYAWWKSMALRTSAAPRSSTISPSTNKPQPHPLVSPRTQGVNSEDRYSLILADSLRKSFLEKGEDFIDGGDQSEVDSHHSEQSLNTSRRIDFDDVSLRGGESEQTLRASHICSEQSEARESAVCESGEVSFLSPTISADDHDSHTNMEEATWGRYAKLLLVIIVIFIVCVGPNVVYVVVMIGNYSYTLKLICTIAITFVKITLSSMVIPKACEVMSILLFPTSAACDGRQFRAYVNIGVFLSSITLISAPLLIVAVTDTRCLLSMFQPEKDVNTEVPYQICGLYDNTAQTCVRFDTATVVSTYETQFSYNGGQCVSAVLSTYVPVFLGFVLLSAPISAVYDLIVAPLLAPYCFARRHSNKFALYCYNMLRLTTWSVPSILANYYHLDYQEDFVDGIAARDSKHLTDSTLDEQAAAREASQLVLSIDVDYFAQAVMRRAFVQLCSTMLIALTFALAAPLAAVACIFASHVQFRHHTMILSQIVDLNDTRQRILCEQSGSSIQSPSSQNRAVAPNFKQCNILPSFSGISVFITMYVFWCCATAYYLNEVAVGATVILILSIFFLAICLWGIPES